jgi:deoxyribonuclease-4
MEKTMLIGAHVSTAGGASKAIARAEEIGAECMQVFASSPRAWKVPQLAETEVEKFRAESKRVGMGPTVVHGKYLCAIGSPDPELVEKSIVSLTAELHSADELGALGVIFHPASHRGQGFEAALPQFTDAMKRVLDGVPGETLLMLETSAGSGDHIGSKFTELEQIIRSVDSPRVAVCLDTQHVWAAGYNIADPAGLEQTVDEFESVLGLGVLRAVHANDSKRELGSAVDRHDNIGDGFIGLDGFRNIMSNKAFADVPFYIEVPGFEKSGPDKPNIDLLKKIRSEVGG